MINLFLGLLLMTSVVFSATGPASSETSQAVNQSQVGSSSPTNNSKILGTFEVRPSYRSLVGEFHSEDSATLGYQFDKKIASFTSKSLIPTYTILKSPLQMV
jgi:hypothetical protein